MAEANRGERRQLSSTVTSETTEMSDNGVETRLNEGLSRSSRSYEFISLESLCCVPPTNAKSQGQTAEPLMEKTGVTHLRTAIDKPNQSVEANYITGN